MSDEVLVEVDGAVAVLTINRAKAKNAVNGAVARGIADALDELEGRKDVAAYILTGAGELRRVAEKVVAEHGVTALAAVHRVGDLQIGDLAVVVAVACPHRHAAFLASRQLIDDLKAQVPIWKHQLFADGDAEWVGAC